MKSSRIAVLADSSLGCDNSDCQQRHITSTPQQPAPGTTPLMTTAILLVAHGSRLDSANRDLDWLGQSLAKRRPNDLIETAYLELAEPDIPTAGAACVERGARHVLLLPVFLSPGRHATLHLAQHRDDLATRFPEVSWFLKPPLGRHESLVDVLQDRIDGPDQSATC